MVLVGSEPTILVWCGSENSTVTSAGAPAWPCRRQGNACRLPKLEGRGEGAGGVGLEGPPAKAAVRADFLPDIDPTRSLPANQALNDSVHTLRANYVSQIGLSVCCFGTAVTCCTPDSG